MLSNDVIVRERGGITVDGRGRNGANGVLEQDSVVVQRNAHIRDRRWMMTPRSKFCDVSGVRLAVSAEQPQSLRVAGCWSKRRTAGWCSGPAHAERVSCSHGAAGRGCQERRRVQVEERGRPEAGGGSPPEGQQRSRLIAHLHLRVVGRAEIAVAVLTIRDVEIEGLGDRHVQLDESRLDLASPFDCTVRKSGGGAARGRYRAWWRTREAFTSNA